VSNIMWLLDRTIKVQQRQSREQRVEGDGERCTQKVAARTSDLVRLFGVPLLFSLPLHDMIALKIFQADSVPQFRALTTDPTFLFIVLVSCLWILPNQQRNRIMN